MGDRAANLRAALDGLGHLGSRGGMSRVYESEPWGVAAQPRFWNMVLALSTPLPPTALLSELKELEVRIGRTPTYRMGPRVIDIDILFYGAVQLDAPGLRIPHPGIMDRAFVLAPLLDLDPGMRHPVSGEALSDRLALIGTGSLVPLGAAEDVLRMNDQHADESLP